MIRQKIYSFPAHPFFFALFFVFFLYAHNIEKLVFADTFSALGIVTGAAIILWALFLLLYRDTRKAGMLCSLFLILFFSYGHVFEIRGADYWIRHRYLLSIYALLFLTGAVTLWRVKRPASAGFTTLLNIIAGVLFLSPLASLVFYQVTRSSLRSDNDFFGNSSIVQAAADDPDIYYIMLDAYAGPASLKEFYNYDDSPFTDYLEKKGFYVVATPRSNHSGTALSLSVLLNMDHLAQLSPTGVVSKKTIKPRELVQHNRVVRFLKERGYVYIHAGSIWEGTYKNQDADRNINIGYFPDFLMMIYKTTALYPYTFNFSIFNLDRVEWERVRYQFSELKKLPGSEEKPVFVFAHFGVPRNPFVFNADGSFHQQRTQEEQAADNARDPQRVAMGLKSSYQAERYINQVAYVNKEVSNLVETILAKSKREPLIIIQSDHGSRIALKKREPPPLEVSDLYVNDRMRNFSAFYLPRGGNKLLYDTITQVNTFRIVFNHYFGTTFERRPDTAYVSLPNVNDTSSDDANDHEEGYDLMDVTDRISY